VRADASDLSKPVYVSFFTFAVMWNSFLAVEASQQPARVGDLGFTRELVVWLVIL
jgi:hypothetical protein